MSEVVSEINTLRSATRSSGQIALEIKDLKTYLYTRWGVVKAVDGVSLSLRDGECLGLVGESGCGKTMFGLSLMRLLPRPAGRIVGGEVLFNGEDIVKKSEAEMREIRGRQISMVLQDPMTALDPIFSVGRQLTETITISSDLKGPALLERAVELLRMVRIPAPAERLAAFPFQMSGGMRQRVVGAIALAQEPRILIADEPTTSLDVTTQANYLRLLKSLQERLNLTLIFITHDFGIVARVCHRVGVMYAGKLVELGDVEDIFDNPRHPYTKCLIDSVPKLDKRVTRLATITGQPPTLHDLPPGCSFRPRCTEAGTHCRPDQYPDPAMVGDRHYVRCWLYQ
ncbi:MAG: ABC transporter ATP-binding protein [Chloroflexi bacterium]|nr:ABC transporter ATP-binding protein [Chloroflexota bacterium]